MICECRFRKWLTTPFNARSGEWPSLWWCNWLKTAHRKMTLAEAIHCTEARPTVYQEQPAGAYDEN